MYALEIVGHPHYWDSAQFVCICLYCAFCLGNLKKKSLDEYKVFEVLRD